MKTNLNPIQNCLLGVVLLHAATGGAQPAVTQIAAGYSHSLFLKSDGSLWAMGNNVYGQLGDGTTNNSFYPEEILSSNVTAVAAGDYHSLFLKSDGSLWGMGANGDYQLGGGIANNRLSPGPMVLSGVKAIAAGHNHSLFLQTDGSLWGMGGNYDGQLGDDTFDDSPYMEVIEPSGVITIAAGGDHSLFVKRHGSLSRLVTELWVMGDNQYGELGDGTSNNTNQPELIESYTSPGVIGTAPVTTIAAGYDQSLFLKADGSLWGMGNGVPGDLGYPFTVIKTPEQIMAGGSAAISAGFDSTLLAGTDGSLRATGNDTTGQLGDGGPAGDTYGFITIETTGVTMVAAGKAHSLFIKQGSLWGMGDNSVGALGQGSLTRTNRPVLIVAGPPPPLGISTYASQPVVIYPVTGVNYVLQMTTNLASGNWVSVTNSIPFVGAQIPGTPGNAATRLQLQ